MSLLDKLDKFKKKVVQEEISPEVKKISERLIDLPLIPSAKLNLIKFLYPLLTRKSTTNKLKKSMKKAIIEKISKF